MKKIIPVMAIMVLVFLADNSGAFDFNELKKIFQQGEQAYHQGDYEQAIASYERVVEMNPDFAPVYNSLGLAHMGVNARQSDIIWLFKVAADIDPQYASPHSNMCKVYYYSGEHDLAEKACLKALSITPDMGSAQLSLAWVYLAGKSQPADAIHYFNKVLEQIDSPMVYFGLGLAYSMKGDRPQVLDIVTKLRGMGENQHAEQLENTLRGSGEGQSQPVIQESYLPLPAIASRSQQSSTLIGTGGPVQPAPVSQPSGGQQMQIRLRGRLSSAGGGAAPAPASAPQVQQPPPPEQPGDSASTGRSAIERIRELQRLRSGGGTSGTTLPAGSGVYY